jgi:hypothetical protein
MCLRRAPENYIASAKAPAGAALDRADTWQEEMRKVAKNLPRYPVSGLILGRSTTRIQVHNLLLLRQMIIAVSKGSFASFFGVEE